MKKMFRSKARRRTKRRLNFDRDKNRLFLKIGLWALALIVVIVIVFCIPKVSDVMKSTYVAEEDTVMVSDKVMCYFVKNESVIYSKKGGSTEYYADEGKHVRAGTEIMKVGREVYKTDQPGIVSYNVDNYETYFLQENIPDGITRKKVESFTFSNTDTKAESLSRSSPLFKVVDNKEWMVIFWVSDDQVTSYNEGKNVKIKFDENTQVDARITGICKQGNEYMIVLKSYDYYKDLAKVRCAEAEVVTVDETGLLIRQDSIVTLDKKPGVYVKQINGDYSFVRVKVLTLVDDSAIVASEAFNEQQADGMTLQIPTIKLYDEILKNGKTMIKSENKDKGGEDGE